ncbi:hypothetical protein ACFUGD_09190 [Streptomyces sp. NPDC057217]|uniref:hypothetical protein n=1 Tax=Streptomyces sp. NPDC057217 TaxID=3346054 RepID=UPI003642FFAA
MNRVGWAAAGAVAVVLGVSGCGGGDGGTGRGAGGASAPAGPRPEDSGPITKAKMRVVLDTVTADVGAPPNDPDWARMDEKPRPGTLHECSLRYKGFDTAADTLDVERTDALTAALTARGWTKSPKGEKRTAEDGTIDLILAVFEKREWSPVLEYRLFSDNRTLSLTAFDKTCVERIGPVENPIPGLRTPWS